MTRGGQLKHKQHTEDYGMSAKKFMLKQQRLRQFFDEELKSRLDSKYLNHQCDTQGFIRRSDKPSKKILENEACGQMPSVDQHPEYASSIKSPTKSDSSKTSEEPRHKSRYCRHFLKGHCQRGESCGFRHDHSVFCTDMQKVFLGGLPPHLTSSLLRKKLTDQ